MSASDGACMHMCTTHKGMEKKKAVRFSTRLKLGENHSSVLTRLESFCFFKHRT